MDRRIAYFLYLVAIEEGKQNQGQMARNIWCLYCKATEPDRFNACEGCCADLVMYLSTVANKEFTMAAAESVLLLRERREIEI